MESARPTAARPRVGAPLAARPARSKVAGASPPGVVKRRVMTRFAKLAAVAALLAAPALAGAAPADDGGKLGTLPEGRYLCEVPGDATGPASLGVKGAWFDIVNASSYAAEGGSGTYLATGDKVLFTRGPMKGAQFERASNRSLERTDDQAPAAKMRCVRTGRAG